MADLTNPEAVERLIERLRDALLDGYLARRYYIKRAGWRWQVWFANADGKPDPSSGAWEWRATSQRFWSPKTAVRVAGDMQVAFADGLWSLVYEPARTLANGGA